MKQFKSLIELMDYFRSEKDCIEYLAKMRWNGIVSCPHCGAIDKIYILSDRTYKCGHCVQKFSVRKGTIFEDSKLPLRKWFIAIYLCAYHSKGISSVQLSKDLAITQKSAWFMLHRIRQAFLSKSFNAPLENEVEMDETYIGGKEKNKHSNKRTDNTQGRSIKTKEPVVGMLERGGNVFAIHVDKTDRTTLESIAFKHIKESSIVYTDEYKGYAGMSAIYTHKKVEHGKGIYVEDKAHTNSIEGYWSLVKRCILGIYHHVSSKHLQKYLDEFSFRYNTRSLNSYEVFGRLMKQIATRITYEELIS